MLTKSDHVERTLEIILVLIVVALSCLLANVPGYKMVVLNLFYLPIVLAAFFLGRYRGGILALFAAISASAVAVLDLSNFVTSMSPLVIGLALTIWGAVLGLTAILVGTLSDERSAKIEELHESYVGVVEDLSKYLQSANQTLKDRSKRICDLSRKVGQELRLSEKEIDDICVAALLQDMESIEITAKVIRKAIDDLGDGDRESTQHTFHGTDLVESLGTVLRGAFPLLVSQSGSTAPEFLTGQAARPNEAPIGAQVIRVVRAYDALMHESASPFGGTQEIFDELRSDVDANHHPVILHALERVVATSDSGKEAVLAGC